jgi:cobalt-zinc-cadmium efflux system outer membrane protein
MKCLVVSISILAFVFPVTSTSAAPVSVARSESSNLTLEDAVRTAYANNSLLRSARLAVESAIGRAERAGAWPNPALSFIAEDVPRDGGLSEGKNLFGVSQTVPFPFKKTFEGRVGRSEVESARTNFALTAIGLERDVKIAFYRVLAAERSLAISHEAAAVAAALANAARKRVQSGAAPLQEELRAQIEYERANSDVYARELERDSARESLFVLMGRAIDDATVVGDLSADTTLAGNLPADTTLVPTEDAVTVAEDLHPLLAGAEARVNRAVYELRRAKLELLPDLDLRIAAGRDEGNNDIIEMEAAISIPLFDFGGGLRREKRAELEAARAEVVATALEFDSSIRKAGHNFRGAARQASAYRDRIIPRAEQALDLVRGGVDAGKFGLIDLLDTQRTLADARLAYVARLLELNMARAEWEALKTTSISTSSTE